MAEAYEYTMMYLTDMNDAGITILPSHRLIKRCKTFKREAFFEKLKQWFEVGELPFSGSYREEPYNNLRQALEEKGGTTTTIGFHHHREDRYYILSLKSGASDETGDDLSSSLKKLDVVVLSRLVLQRSLGLSKDDLDNEELFHYSTDMTDAISQVDSGSYEMIFLLNPTKMEQVKEVANNSLLMPRKSTYFYPKVLSGMVFNKIDRNEIIRVP